MAQGQDRLTRRSFVIGTAGLGAAAPRPRGATTQMIEQAAMTQVYAVLAWPRSRERLLS